MICEEGDVYETTMVIRIMIVAPFVQVAHVCSFSCDRRNSGGRFSSYNLIAP
jgi:hypothetical protein